MIHGRQYSSCWMYSYADRGDSPWVYERKRKKKEVQQKRENKLIKLKTRLAKLRVLLIYEVVNSSNVDGMLRVVRWLAIVSMFSRHPNFIASPMNSAAESTSQASSACYSWMVYIIWQVSSYLGSDIVRIRPQAIGRLVVIAHTTSNILCEWRRPCNYQ